MYPLCRNKFIITESRFTMTKIILFGDSLFNGYRNGHDTDLITTGIRQLTQMDVQNRSLSGATTVEALDFLDRIDQDADLIVLEYGTNDAATDWGIKLEAYEKNLNLLVEKLRPERLILLGPAAPDPHNPEITQYYGSKHLKAYNQVAKKCAQDHGIPFVNLVAAFANLQNISSYYLEDGQHLTDKGNKILIDVVVNAIKAKLAL